MKQSQRLVYLDLMRVVAMVMMIMGHSFFDLVRPNLVNTSQFPWSVWEFLRGLTAPMFLFISGIVQVFANKREQHKLPKETVYRRIRTSLLVIFLAYFLNFPVQKAFHIIFQSKQNLIPFFQVNILQIIGTTLLWVLFYFLITKNNRQLGRISLWTGIFIFALTPLVHLIDWYNILPLPIAPYFSLEKGSYFTIFPFSAFTFFGVTFGTYLERFELPQRANVIIKYGFILFNIVLPLGIAVYIFINSFSLPFYDVFKANSGISIVRLACVLALLSLLVLLYKKYLYNFDFVQKVSTTLGKNALFVYVVHLIILYGLPWYPGFATIFNRTLDLLPSFAASLLVVFISFSLVFILEDFTSKKRFLKSVFRYGVVSLLILLMLV
ncbi:MAG: heparan-alpha-glucosaminide N-acetyltransferase domain-containing protein [Candidatus Kapaibacteriota bacterium]